MLWKVNNTLGVSLILYEGEVEKKEIIWPVTITTKIISMTSI